VFLLNNRQLQSGSVRVRDGQTLVLSGIIQETERSSVNKIPILGDIPILGSLFRSTVNDNQRQELIVLLTPEILDDSDQSAFGYSYTPSDEVQEIIERSQQR
jgi:type IV pilus assembly protein PilQ